MHWPEHFYILGRKGFPQQELLLQELLGKKGHLLFSGCLINNIVGLEGQEEGTGRQQRQNNQREKRDIFNGSEWKG